jgi:hypothetical protein
MFSSLVLLAQRTLELKDQKINFLDILDIWRGKVIYCLSLKTAKKIVQFIKHDFG